jgi:hypothetical protein
MPDLATEHRRVWIALRQARERKVRGRERWEGGIKLGYGLAVLAFAIHGATWGRWLAFSFWLPFGSLVVVQGVQLLRQNPRQRRSDTLKQRLLAAFHEPSAHAPPVPPGRADLTPDPCRPDSVS